MRMNSGSDSWTRLSWTWQNPVPLANGLLLNWILRWSSGFRVTVWNSCSLAVASFSAAASVKAALHLGRKELSSLIFLLFSVKVVEDGYEFFAKRQLVTLFSAPNYCGEFDNAGAMMSVDETLMCSFQVWYPKILPRGQCSHTSDLLCFESILYCHKTIMLVPNRSLEIPHVDRAVFALVSSEMWQALAGASRGAVSPWNWIAQAELSAVSLLPLACALRSAALSPVVALSRKHIYFLAHMWLVQMTCITPLRVS